MLLSEVARLCGEEPRTGRPRLRRARAVNRKTYARALSLTRPNSQLTPSSVRPEPDTSASARAALSGMRPHVTSSLEDGRGSQQMFEKILTLIARLRAPPAPACGALGSNVTDNNGRDDSGGRHAPMDGRRVLDISGQSDKLIDLVSIGFAVRCFEECWVCCRPIWRSISAPQTPWSM
jgi:hypothetical protein